MPLTCGALPDACCAANHTADRSCRNQSITQVQCVKPNRIDFRMIHLPGLADMVKN